MNLSHVEAPARSPTRAGIGAGEPPRRPRFGHRPRTRCLVPRHPSARRRYRCARGDVDPRTGEVGCPTSGVFAHPRPRCQGRRPPCGSTQPSTATARRLRSVLYHREVLDPRPKLVVDRDRLAFWVAGQQEEPHRRRSQTSSEPRGGRCRPGRRCRVPPLGVLAAIERVGARSPRGPSSLDLPTKPNGEVLAKSLSVVEQRGSTVHGRRQGDRYVLTPRRCRAPGRAASSCRSRTHQFRAVLGVEALCAMAGSSRPGSLRRPGVKTWPSSST